MNRRFSAFTASFALQVFVIVASSWFAARAVVSYPARKPASSLAIVVLQAQKLSPDPTPDDLGIHADPSAARLSLPGFWFDFAKVITRAGGLSRAERYSAREGRLSIYWNQGDGPTTPRACGVR